MESPNKRLKQSPPEAEADFVALGGDGGDEYREYGYGEANGSLEQAHGGISHAPRAPRAMYEQQSRSENNRNAWNDPRNDKDKPTSKHALPGHEPWILIKTKFGRRFVHNAQTKESFWHIPTEVMPGVREFESWEREQKEKDANAKWAEQQLKDMREKSKAEEVNKAADEEGRSRRRRSESLQREDEEAMMAELAAEAEKAEEKDAKQAVRTVESLQSRIVHRGDPGNESESSYEEIEVTDSEFEDEEAEQAQRKTAAMGDSAQLDQQDDGPVEFGEDDIAYQLAAMEQDHGVDEAGSEYDSRPDAEDEDVDQHGYEEDEGPPLTEEDAANLFRDMLDDHRISPFTPWENLIDDESDSSIVMDDRYTVLPNMRSRKAIWEAWVKDTAARLKEERAKMEREDPRVPYLAFLAEKASPKLYWPEFKRKFKKEPVMNERKLGEKEREKLYREHVNRLKLPESTRKADLRTLVDSIPLRGVNGETRLDALPQQVLSHLHYISLPTPVRDEVVKRHISALPPPPDGDQEDGELTVEQRVEEDKKQAERRKREAALQARERQVDEARRKAEKEERWAKRELREEEREVRRAMAVGDRGLRAQLRDGDEER